MNDVTFYNFYHVSVGNNINEPTAFTNFIKKETPDFSSTRLKYLILSPYCYYYIKPMWSENGVFLFTPEKQDILVKAGLMGRVTSPFDFELIISHALAPQRVFLVTYGTYRDSQAQLVGDKTTQAFLYHLVSHVEMAQSLIALRQELGKI